MHLIPSCNRGIPREISQSKLLKAGRRETSTAIPSQPRTEKGVLRILCGISHFASPVAAKNIPFLGNVAPSKARHALKDGSFDSAATSLRRITRSGLHLVAAARSPWCTSASHSVSLTFLFPSFTPSKDKTTNKQKGSESCACAGPPA